MTRAEPMLSSSQVTRTRESPSSSLSLIHICNLKYFYPNYKDYYYLIYEDQAIHKSVGEFVDKGARVKATKETCYTKKSGSFLPQPSSLWTPDFKNTCKDKTGFFEFCPECFKDTETVSYTHLDVYKRQALT